MNKIIRGIGCFVLSCLAFAIPICFTLLVTYEGGLSWVSIILALLMFAEFSLLYANLYFYGEE